MDFRISDTFTDSLAKLTPDEQKAVKNTAFDLQINPASPGMNFHRLEKPRDKNFFSVRINDDVRLILHRTPSSLLLCYVDHHDKAYRWAERRKLETHPKTGAAQFVEIRERIEEVIVPKYVEQIPDVPVPVPSKPLLFSKLLDDELLSYGVPSDWLAVVREADEDSLLEIVDHLPREAAEALLELATGGKPKPSTAAQPGTDPFEHPDAMRRFRVMTDVDALRQALDYPWDKWTVFLHPAQRQLIEREYSGPARVSGSAGTGKTIVALHRAVFLARKWPDSRVLLATFSETLANALHDRMRRLVSSEPRLAERLEVGALTAIGIRLYTQQFGAPKLLSNEQLTDIVTEVADAMPVTKFSVSFLVSEWNEIVDAWQLNSWETYRDARRLGRKTRLSEKVRQSLWVIFEEVNKRISTSGRISNAGLFTRLAEQFRSENRSPFDYVVIDESQDITAAQLSFLAALGAKKPDSLFFAGDLGQRIFQTPFSWKSVGVDIRGRSRTLTVNYRTSHQIRQHADHLLGPEVADVDGISENRKGTISVFNGPAPEFRECSDAQSEEKFVSEWITRRIAEGVALHEIGVIVRSRSEIDRAIRAVELTGVQHRVLDDHMSLNTGNICICTMHLAKGLEFRAVCVMACDDEIVPLQQRIEEITDEADLEEVYATERHLLYVAVTRARDYLLVSSGGPASEFMDDLKL
jgi:superfamily I DNA/RNA helicase/mRNA-degrading endonuclease RelE of RelBE toxin-antitoxin system